MVGLGHTEWAKACPRLTWCSGSLTCLSMNILKWSGSQSLFRFKSLIFSSVRNASVLYMRVCSNNLCSSPDKVSCFIFSFFLSILEPGIIHNGTHGIFKADYICLTIHFSKDYCVAILFLQAILEPLFSVYISYESTNLTIFWCNTDTQCIMQPRLPTTRKGFQSFSLLCYWLVFLSLVLECDFVHSESVLKLSLCDWCFSGNKV